MTAILIEKFILRIIILASLVSFKAFAVQPTNFGVLNSTGEPIIISASGSYGDFYPITDGAVISNGSVGYLGINSKFSLDATGYLGIATNSSGSFSYTYQEYDYYFFTLKGVGDCNGEVIVQECYEITRDLIAPTNVSIPSSSEINVPYDISWDGVSGQTYDIYEKINEGVYAIIGNSVETPIYHIIEGKPEGVYQYQIKACNDNECSDYSDPVEVVVSDTPINFGLLNNTGEPLIVSPSGSNGHFYPEMEGATISNGGIGYLGLDSKFSLDATGYLGIATNSSGNFSYTYQESNLYSFALKNPLDCGVNPIVNECYEVTESPILLDTPTNINSPSTINHNTNFDITWDAVKNAEYYEVNEKVNGNEATQLGLNIQSTSYTVVGKMEAQYEFSVKACDSSGCSLLSDYNTVLVTSDLAPLEITPSTNVVTFDKSLADSFIDLGDISKVNNLVTQAFTVETWAKPAVFESDVNLIGVIQDNGSSEFGWALGTKSWGKFIFAVATENTDTLTYLSSRDDSNEPTCRSFDENIWHHVVGVYNGIEMQIYVNGILCNTSKEQSGDISYPVAANFVLGMFKDDDENKAFDGAMSDTRLWNRALTQEEIRENMGSRLLGSESGLVGYWKLNEGTGNIVEDLSNSNLTGQLNQTSWDETFLPLTEYSLSIPPSFTSTGWHTQGSQIIAPDGSPIILKAMNWFGFQTTRNVVHGLWEVDYEEQLDKIKDLGFNAIRLPYSNSLLKPEAKVTGYISSGNAGMVRDVTPALEAMDIFINAAGKRGLYIILDRHSLEADVDDPDLWYNDVVSEKQWIRDWEILADRYKDNSYVIGADLHNEPHGVTTWGTGHPLTDWRLAAQRAGNAVLAINSNWLIIVEGMDWSDHFFENENVNTGGIQSYPIELYTPDKVVYSPHEYGPDDAEDDHRWFIKGITYEQAKSAWGNTWGYILDQNIAPILIGEFGGRYVDQSSTIPLTDYPVESGMTQGDAAIWYEYMVNYIQEKNINFAYWTWTPNSTNTGGVLDDDYEVIQDKIDALGPIIDTFPSPDNTQVSQVGTTVSLSWAAVEHASQYQIQGLNSSLEWVSILVTDLTSIIIDEQFNGFSAFRVMACSQYSCINSGEWSDQVLLKEKDSDFITDIPFETNSALSHIEDITSTEIAEIPGNISITNQGGANYTIPLDLPEGKGGYTPEINLSYSSFGGNSIAGVGWSLSVTSSIVRCQKILEEDNSYQEILFDNRDALCFGGQKLRLISGSNLTDGAEYRLDKNSLSKVVQIGNGTNAYFEVYSTTGEKRVFGNTDNSTLYDVETSQPYNWKLSTKQNNFSQEITYTYSDLDEQEKLITSVSYSENTIEFVYEERTDQSTLYYLGNKTEKTKRLKKINVTNHDDEIVRSYHLEYETSLFSERSLLESIILCNDELGSICSQPTTFDYSDENLSGFDNEDTVLNIDDFTPVDGKSDCESYTMYSFCSIYKMSISDLNKDGSPELIVSTRDGSTGKILAFEYSNGEFSLNNSLSVFDVDLEDYNYTQPGQTLRYEFPWQILENHTTGLRNIIVDDTRYYDWDGDGIDEASPRVTGNISLYRNYFSYAKNQYLEFDLTPYYGKQRDITIDYNGDGLLDRMVPFALYRSVENQANGDWTTTRTVDDTFYLLEINRTENGIYKGEVLYTPDLSYYSSCSGSYCTPEVDIDDIDGIYDHLWKQTSDFNGDGILDFIRMSNNTRAFSGDIKSGRNFEDVTSHSFDLASDLDSYFSGGTDINGDGKSDYVYVNDNSVYWRQSLSNGNKSEEVLTTINWTVDETDSYLWEDLDGDNQAEIIHFDHSSQTIRIRFDKNTDNKQLDKLTAVTTGLGKSYNLNYKRLTDNSVYEIGTGAEDLDWGNGSQVRDIISTMSVVSELTEAKSVNTNGTILSETTNYFYKGFRSQAGGKGTLGFAEISSTIQSNQMTTTKYFLQESPFDGQLYKKLVSYGGYNVSQEEVTQWWNLSVNNNQSRFVSPKVTIIDKHYVNTQSGAIVDTDWATRKTLSTAYSVTTDGYPLLDSSTQSVTDKIDSGSSTQIVSYTYNDEDTTNWRINRPTRIIKEYERSGQTTVTQTSDYEYNTDKGGVEFEIKEPDSTDQKWFLKTHFSYDSVGNIIQKTSCSLHFEDDCDSLSVPDTSDDEYKVFRRKTFNYDTDNRYLASVANSDYIEQSFYQYNKFGSPTEVRTIQYDSRIGQREYNSYDSLGNLYFTYKNTGESTFIIKEQCTTRTDCPNNATFTLSQISNATANTISFIDFSGRTVKNATQLLDGDWSFTDKSFDVLGRLVKESQPYKENDNVYRKEISYDGTGRKYLVISSSNYELTTEFSYNNGSITQVVNGTYSDEVNTNIDLNRTRQESHNGREELIQTQDAHYETTNYTYSALGILHTVTGIEGALITQSNDNYGRVTQLDDPDKGVENYYFNALGEEVQQVNANLATKTHYRNAIGQIETTEIVKSSQQLTYTFDYNQSPFLHTESTTDVSTTYTYDNYHRLSNKLYTLDSKQWSSDIYYDDVGRLFRETDISGYDRGLQYQYSNGTLDRVFEVKTGNAYYRATASDAFNNITNYTVGVDINISKQYDLKTGFLTSINAANGSIQNQNYRYDRLGNLRYRSDLNVIGDPLVEVFDYDSLNRLTEVRLQDFLTKSMTYDDNGNILTKSDVSSSFYQYGQEEAQCNSVPGVHAVSSIGADVAYCYDQAGNQTHTYKNNQLTREITYSLFNKALQIHSNSGDSWFSYDANETKFKRVDNTGEGNVTTYYVNGNEVIYNADGSSEIKRYIQDIAIHSIKSSGAETLNYLFNDHLGSSSIITDNLGTVEQTASFDAFGKRRDPSLWNDYTDPYNDVVNLSELLAVTQKGFTGHQQVDHASIIHMGGRIYDPEIGRFIQADPIVQAPKDGQSLNRYSYVFNNPLSYTDPTGYVCETLSEGHEMCDSSIGATGSTTTDATVNRQRGDSSNDAVNSANGSDRSENSASMADVGTNQNQDPSLGQQGLSLGLDVAPVIGGIKGVAQTITGEEWFTGQELNRWEEAGYAVLGFFGLKGAAKIGDVADFGEASLKVLRQGDNLPGSVNFKGLVQNRNLQDLTHHDLTKAFDGTGFTLSNHAINRLKHSRTRDLGFGNLNDISKVFNKGTRFDAGGGEVGFSYRGLEAIVNPKTNNIVTFRPEKLRR